MHTTPSPARLWRLRDFRLLLTGRLASQVGDQLQFLALPLLVLALTGSAAQAGAILGLQTVVQLLAGLAAGALVDRWDRRKTMIGCEIARAVLTATVAVALVAGVLGLPQLYLVAILSGVFSTVFNAANSSALPNVVPADRLPDALGTFSAAGNGLRVAGAPLAGITYAVAAWLPFGLNAVSFVLSALTLRSIRADFQLHERHARTGPRAVLADIGEGLTWLWRQRVIRTLALLDAGDSLRFGAGYLLIIVLATRVNAGPLQIGLVFAGAGVGALTGSVAAPLLIRRLPLGRLAITMLWTEALAFSLYAVAPTWWWLLAVAFTESVVAPIYNIALDSYRLRITPDAVRERVTAAIDTLTTGGSALGAAGSGVLIGMLGPIALTLALTGVLAALAVTATASRTVRRAAPDSGEA